MDESNKEVKNTLSGERIHGLPNETIAAPNAKAVPISNSNISYILTRIKWINEDQSIRNEDIFGPVTHNTTVIAIQVHNRLSYLRQGSIDFMHYYYAMCKQHVESSICDRAMPFAVKPNM